MHRTLLHAFLSSVCQWIVFGIVYIALLFFTIWPPINVHMVAPWSVIVAVLEFLLPVLCGIGGCFLVNRSVFRFNSRNLISKISVYRLLIRLIVAFCFLIVGYIGETKWRQNLISLPDLVNKFGGFSQNAADILTNFWFYILISLFPILYALFEYLFVAVKSDHGYVKEADK